MNINTIRSLLRFKNILCFQLALQFLALLYTDKYIQLFRVLVQVLVQKLSCRSPLAAERAGLCVQRKTLLLNTPLFPCIPLNSSIFFSKSPVQMGWSGVRICLTCYCHFHSLFTTSSSKSFSFESHVFRLYHLLLSLSCILLFFLRSLCFILW